MTRISTNSWDAIFKLLCPLLPQKYKFTLLGDKIHKLADVIPLPDPESVYFRLVSIWDDPARLVLDSHEPLSIISNRSEWASVPDISQWMMFLDLVSYLPDDILVKVDRASMGVSLETRIPLLDHRIVELVWGMPLSIKVRKGRGKWILRQVLNKYVPNTLIERPKMGFGIPIDQWLRGPLRDWAEDLLDEAHIEKEGFLDPKLIRQMWIDHLSGLRNWQYYIWSVLMFQAWLGERCQPHGLQL